LEGATTLPLSSSLTYILNSSVCTQAFLARFPEEKYAEWLEEEEEKEKQRRQREKATRGVIYDDFCLAIRPGATSKQEEDQAQQAPRNNADIDENGSAQLVVKVEGIAGDCKSEPVEGIHTPSSFSRRE
jgi:hypothetical protein